jgi:DNA-binding NarL/FixJ family response regulator
VKPKLSNRDQEILDLLARGKRDKQIAAYFEVDQGTLRVAIQRVCASLGAKTRCQAVAKYVKDQKADYEPF